MAEWVIAFGTLVSLLLIWQQNRILARQASSERPSVNVLKIRRYWPMWTMGLMMLAIWSAVIYDVYDRQFGAVVQIDKHRWDTDPLEDVTGQRFASQTVVLDGRRFLQCSFDNVTFEYEGTARMEAPLLSIPSVGPNGEPHYRFISRNVIVGQTIEILRALDALKDTVKVAYSFQQSNVASLER